VLLLVWCLACAPAHHEAAPQTSAGRPDRAPVVVTIVVDQLAAWIADERWSELPKAGGFARLLREGTRVREMRYAHAVTDTAPGHAALYTGVTPRVSGIVGNEIPIDREKRESVLLDRDTALVVHGLATSRPGASIRALAPDVPTLADRLRAARP